MCVFSIWVVETLFYVQLWSLLVSTCAFVCLIVVKSGYIVQVWWCTSQHRVRPHPPLLSP